MVPKQLADIAERVHDPAVTEVGVTKTAEGRWALLVQVKKGTSLPIEDLERMVGDYEIVYEEAGGPIPAARPAYPARGE